ncbi:hypothetical protein COO60DRAFT_196559 [Scenedesmus sp. NREL 46B-D3]|nr:hypothetical protein COO60DRAFT_196559 [Scenedesmus sp. NREL 46B-D3]
MLCADPPAGCQPGNFDTHLYVNHIWSGGRCLQHDTMVRCFPHTVAMQCCRLPGGVHRGGAGCRTLRHTPRLLAAVIVVCEWPRLCCCVCCHALVLFAVWLWHRAWPVTIMQQIHSKPVLGVSVCSAWAAVGPHGSSAAWSLHQVEFQELLPGSCTQHSIGNRSGVCVDGSPTCGHHLSLHHHLSLQLVRGGL